MAEKGKPLPKFGEWDVTDPSSANDFSVIFNKARNERKYGTKVSLPPKRRNSPNYNAHDALRKSHYICRAMRRLFSS
ncbi:RPM1-interacting protein [Vigna angularis]|uniref:RPM1-interacting protein n=1 Tax=Phaseolus angularis TaxID=3914 RepID=A0A8T0K0T4_PHAAN|nr:protein NOI4-like [Vigna angularis]KAG2390660.1 RPM1-interacting protein [Vigna angularis]